MSAPKNPALTRLQTIAPPSLPSDPNSALTSASSSRSLSTGLATPSIFSATPGSRLPSTIPSKNPLALRLYKVLGANYNDSSTREALETLSSFYAPTPAPNGVQLNVQDKPSAEANDDDEPDEVADEEAWGAEYTNKLRKKEATKTDVPLPVDGELALRARKNLRRDIEAKLAESSGKFLTAFAEVDKVRPPA